MRTLATYEHIYEFGSVLPIGVKITYENGDMETRFFNPEPRKIKVTWGFSHEVEPTYVMGRFTPPEVTCKPRKDEMAKSLPNPLPDEEVYFIPRKSVIYTEINPKKCECGADSTKSPIHSDWCPKHAKP